MKGETFMNYLVTVIISFVAFNSYGLTIAENPNKSKAIKMANLLDEVVFESGHITYFTKEGLCYGSGAVNFSLAYIEHDLEGLMEDDKDFNESASDIIKDTYSLTSELNLYCFQDNPSLNYEQAENTLNSISNNLTILIALLKTVK